MTGKERLASLGFPIYAEHAKAAECPRLRSLDDEGPATIAKIAGNTWFLPNAGMVLAPSRIAFP